MEFDRPERCEETVPFPDMEFDNGYDIERDERRQTWERLDRLILSADRAELATALMFLNNSIGAADRQMVEHVLSKEVTNAKLP